MRLRVNFFLLVFFACLTLTAQQEYKVTFSNLSKAEKRWTRRHPFAALKVKRLTKEAMQVVNAVKSENLLDGFESGGKLDAFRHSFTMAYLAQQVSVSKLRALGLAHEEANYEQFKKGMPENSEVPDSLSGVMDLFNNEVGFFIGIQNKNATPDSLKKLVINAIKRGEAFYMRRDSKGKYLDCNGKVIDMENWQGKWYVPKCLVMTNQ